MDLGSTATFHFDPEKNSGLTHAKGITIESSRTLEQLLEENFSKHHIFTSTEDEKGVWVNITEKFFLF
jgi:hypothetical protein